MAFVVYLLKDALLIQCDIWGKKGGTQTHDLFIPWRVLYRYAATTVPERAALDGSQQPTRRLWVRILMAAEGIRRDILLRRKMVIDLNII